MFDENSGNYDLPHHFDDLLTYEDDLQTPGTAKNCANGLTALCGYFKRAVQERRVPEDAEEQRKFLLRKDSYMNSLATCVDYLRKEIAAYGKEAISATNSGRRTANLLDPEEPEKRKKAFKRYCRGMIITKCLLLLKGTVSLDVY
jgi:hypothetical protein